MKKRVISLFLVTIMTCISLMGCGAKTAEETAEPAAQSDNGEAENTQDSSGEKIKLQFMGWEASAYETETNKAALQAYMDANPNVEVEYIAVPYDDFHTKLMTMMVGGAAPDCFYLDVPYAQMFIEEGLLLDITSIFDEYMAGEELIDWSYEKMEQDGKYYGIDSCIVGNILFYNKTLFDEAGIPYPPSDPEESWTWEEFLDAAQKLTKRDGDTVTQYGCYGFEDITAVRDYYENAGYDIFTDDLGEVSLSNPEYFAKVAEMTKALRTEYGVSPEAVFMENAGMSANQMLQTGKVAMIFAGSPSMQELANMDFDFGVAPLPTIDGHIMNANNCSYNASVWSGTEHPEEAMELVSYLVSRDFQLEFVRSGLWMSNRADLYEPENFDQWFNPEVHPEEFKDMTSLFYNGHVATPELVRNAPEVKSIMKEEMESFYYQDKDINQVIDDITTRGSQAISE